MLNRSLFCCSDLGELSKCCSTSSVFLFCFCLAKFQINVWRVAVWCTHNAHLHGSMVYTQCATAWQYGAHTMHTCMAVWCTHNAHLHGNREYTQCAPAWQYGVHTMHTCMAVWCTHNAQLHGNREYTQCAPAWQFHLAPPIALEVHHFSGCSKHAT